MMAATQLFPRSFYFDPTYQEYIICGSYSMYDIGGNDATFSFRVNMDDITSLVVPISRGWYGSGGWYLQLNPANEWNIIHNTSSVMQTSGALSGTAGEWVTWTFKKIGGGAWHVYKNKIEVSYAVSVNSDPSTGSWNVIIGNNGGYTIDSKMVDVRWWNRALSDTEISEMVDGKEISSGLIGWWKLQESSGPTAVDSSVSGNDGTIYNYAGDANFFSSDGFPLFLLGILDEVQGIDSLDIDAILSISDVNKPWQKIVTGLSSVVRICIGGGYVWATNYFDSSIKQIDPIACQVVNSVIPAASCQPEGISYGFGYIWAVGNNSGYLYKIDPTTCTVVDSLVITGGSLIGGCVCGANYVWVTSVGNAKLFKVNPSPMSIAGSVTLTFGPDTSLEYDDTGYIYAPSYYDDNQIAKVDELTDDVTYITVGQNPYGVAISDSIVYVSNIYDHTISKINRTTGAVVGSISLDSVPFGLAYGDGILYVAMLIENTLRKYDISTDELIETVPLDVGVGSPYQALYDDGSVFVSHGNTMTRIIGFDREILGASIFALVFDLASTQEGLIILTDLLVSDVGTFLLEALSAEVTANLVDSGSMGSENISISAVLNLEDLGDGSFSSRRILTDTLSGSLTWLRNHTPDYNITGSVWTDVPGLDHMVSNNGKMYNGSEELPPYTTGSAQCYINHGYTHYTIRFNHRVGTSIPAYETSGVFLRSTGLNGSIFFYYEQGHFGVDSGASTLWTYYCPDDTTYSIRISDTGSYLYIWIDDVLRGAIATTAGLGNTCALFYAPHYDTTIWFTSVSIDGDDPKDLVFVDAIATVNDIGLGLPETLNLIDLRTILDSGIASEELVSWTKLLQVLDLGTSIGPFHYIEEFDYPFYSNYLFYTGTEPSNAVWVYNGITPGGSWPLNFVVPGDGSSSMYQEIDIPEGSAFGFGLQILSMAGVGGSAYLELTLTIYDSSLNVLVTSYFDSISPGDIVYLPFVNNGDMSGPFRCEIVFRDTFYYPLALSVDHFFVSPFSFNEARIFTDNDASSTNLIMYLNGIKIMDTYLSSPDTTFWNYLPILITAAINTGPTNVPPAHYPELIHLDPNYVQLPSHNAAFVAHYQDVIASMNPEDGITNPEHPEWPQYPEIIVKATANNKPFVFSMEPPYNVNTSFFPAPNFVFTPTGGSLHFDMLYADWIKKSIDPSNALFYATQPVGRLTETWGALYAPDGWACWRYNGSNALTLSDYTIEFDLEYSASDMFAVGLRWTDAGGYKLYQQVGVGLWLTKHTSDDLLDIGTLVYSGSILDVATHCRIVITGNHIQVYLTVDSVELLAVDAYDNDFSQGSFGLFANGDGWILDNLVVSGLSQQSEYVEVLTDTLISDLGIGVEEASAIASMLVSDLGYGSLEAAMITNDIFVSDGPYSFSENFEGYFLYSNYLLHTDDDPANIVWTYSNLTFLDADWPIQIERAAGTPPGLLTQIISTDVDGPFTFQFSTGYVMEAPGGITITLQLVTYAGVATKVLSTSPGPGEEQLMVGGTYSVTLDVPQSGTHDVICRLFMDSLTSGAYCKLMVYEFQLSKTSSEQLFLGTTTEPLSSYINLLEDPNWEDMGSTGTEYWFRAVNRNILTNQGELYAYGSRSATYIAARIAVEGASAWKNYAVTWDWSYLFTDPNGEVSMAFRWTDDGGYRISLTEDGSLKLYKDIDPSLYADPQELGSASMVGSSASMRLEVKNVPIRNSSYDPILLFRDLVPETTYSWGSIDGHEPDFNLDAEEEVWNITVGTVEILESWYGVWGDVGSYHQSPGASAVIELGTSALLKPKVYKARLWMQNIITMAEAGILIRTNSDMSEFFYVGFHGTLFAIYDSDPRPPGERHYLSGTVASCLTVNLPEGAEPIPYPSDHPQVYYVDLECIDDGYGVEVRLNGVTVFNVQLIPYYQSNTYFGISGGDWYGVIGAISNISIEAATVGLINVYADGILKISATDNDFVQGSIGFLTVGNNATSWVDNILVSSISTDEVMFISNTFSMSDVGSAIAEIIMHDVSFGLSDSGQGIDTVHVSAYFSVLDSGFSSSEEVQIIAEALIQEHGFGVDVVDSIIALLDITDSTTGTDNINILNALQIDDLGSEFSEQLNVVVRALIQDQGTTISEILQILAWAWVNDEAFSRDVIAVMARVLMDEGIVSSEIIKVFNRFTLTDSGLSEDEISELFKMLDILYLESAFGIEIELDNQLF